MRGSDEVLGLMAQLVKADGDIDRQLDLVKMLGGVPMTMDLLVATKVGSAVKPLKKSEHAPLADAAKSLLNAWRTVVDDHEAQVMLRSGF